ncbi:PhzF family phenazine biosynthesis protein [Carboxylicivirga taeanensis]|uniref:PhzF family phenazine biosynthesis protein n=1 Tax=Carboxylicivirga taeanensis TaxID=1416875 RepID=UPI003F6DB328
MRLTIYQIDAFTDKIFGGNPACVVPLEDWLPDELLLTIAKENAVAETAFFVQNEEGIHLRWFTPDLEMDLCGHATLAAAYVLKVHLNHVCNKLVFETLSGQLQVRCEKDMFTLDLPARPPQPDELPKLIKEAISIQPDAVLKARDYVLVYPSESTVMNLQIDRNAFDKINLGTGGVIVTSKGSSCDFVSRFFTPQATILEDPVTGSAHCTLTPYWSRQLNKTKMTARQLSERGGVLHCENKDSRVLVSGKARTYLVGHIWIE